MAKKSPVLLKLEEIGLEQYASALIDDQGYDDLAALDGLTVEEAGSIADDLQMKPGHKRAFVGCFGTADNAQAEVTRKGARRTMAKSPVLLKLEEIGLEQYASALIDDQGYDDMAALQSVTKE